MKKALCLLLVLVTIFSLTVIVHADDEPEYSVVSTSTEYYEDGSYLETVIAESEADVAPYRLTTYTKQGYKRLRYCNSQGDLEWTATVLGEFEYTNFNCSCTIATIDYSISNTKWKIPSATATKSGNKAIGNVTAKYYYLGINTKTVNETITLTCSATGVLS